MTRKRRRSRLALIVLLLVLLEAALQLAAPLVQSAMRRRGDPLSPDAPLTILCVGDSHTFGLHLSRAYAYPSFLQAILEERFQRRPNVVNRGIPGQNTAQVAAGLLSDLDDFRPDLVLVLAGTNDTWNTDREVQGPLGWLGRLRLWRLLRVLAAGVTTPHPFELRTDEHGEIVVDRGDGARRVNVQSTGTIARTGSELSRVVHAGLARSVEACRDFGAEPILMTYAESAGPFALVNAAIRELAQREGVRLVDHERAFREYFAERGYEELMFTDYHPNAAGYRRMAGDIAAALTAAGRVPRHALRREPMPAERIPPSLPEVLTAEPGRVLLAGPDGWAWQALVSELANDPQEHFEQGGIRIPLRAGPLLALSRDEPAFSGRFGSQPTWVPVSPAFGERASGPLGLCVLLLRDIPVGGGESRLPAIVGLSGPFPLER